MTYSHDGQRWLIRLNKGERLVESLADFVKEKNIRGGWISGLGGFTKAELGFYDLEAREYLWKEFDMLLELTSLTGNIAWQDDEPILHLHATISDKDYKTYGGHLKEATVAGTIEVLISDWSASGGLSRSKDADIGLSLLDL